MSDTTHRFGWIPPEDRTTQQQDTHERIVAMMPKFALPPSGDKGRFALWQFCLQANGGKHIRYVHQVTGSCVGAGGSNAVRTLARVEIAQGDAEMWPAAEMWWPWTYGQSRRRAGINGRGDGSFGSAYAEAIRLDGCFASDEATGQSLPLFKDDGGGWLQLSSAIETEWSDGGATAREPWVSLAKKHPVKTVAPLHSSNDVAAAHQNGYAVTMASNFGTRTIRPQGSPAVNLATWDDTWPHQMYSDETWDHPTLGRIHRIGNNWGPNAHPAPTQGEPPGGFYITADTMDRICRSSEGEVYAFSSFDGFPSRELSWFV